jgi:hypothetical protein
MNENEQRGLQRLDIESKLPAGFQNLSEEEKRSLVKRLQDQDIEVRGELLRKVGKSKLAEHDLAVGIDAVNRLDHERKIYSKQMKGETGSGTYDLHIRGGDTKFIIPVLVVVGVIILGILLIVVLK